MRLALLILALVSGACAAIAVRAAASPPPTVSCESVVLRPRSVDWSKRVLYGRVTFAWARLHQVAVVEGPLPYWSKVGLYVRAGRTPVSISVPPAWRSRAGVNWGDQGRPVGALRVAGCPAPPNVWNGYAGGFHVRTPACVPLVVRVGGRSTVVRFAIGRPCALRPPRGHAGV